MERGGTLVISAFTKQKVKHISKYIRDQLIEMRDNPVFSAITSKMASPFSKGIQNLFMEMCW